MHLISTQEGWWLLAFFGVTMLALVYFFSKERALSSDGFLLAGRNVSWPRGALSIAVSWIWAPAIFIAALQAYTKGIAGAFWFVVPNVLCFFVFAIIALRVKREMPAGYTLPQFMLKRFAGSKRTHLIFVLVFFLYQLGAIIINALAGGTLLHILTGIPFTWAVLALSGIALLYSLISGLKASILTDMVQMLVVLIVAGVLVPWVIVQAGGLGSITAGLGGVTGEFSNIFHPWVAYTMGIPITLGLIAGPVADQMFFQRTFAVKEGHLVKTFVVGGLLFGLVPLLLSLLGFVAAGPEISNALSVTDAQMVAPVVIGHFLPKGALLLFVCMAFAGLSSTLDSAYAAMSSLSTVDIYKRYIKPEATDAQLLRAGRVAMLLLAVFGTGIALLQPQLLWVFLIYGAVSSAAFFPIVLSLFSKRVTAAGAFWGVLCSLLLSLPLSIYANVQENPHLIVVAALLSVCVGLVVCLFTRRWQTV